jgi:hypothetical protein
MHPLKEEASTIKLLLAHVANHLEKHSEPHAQHTFVVDMTTSLVPCSLAWRSPTSSILLLLWQLVHLLTPCCLTHVCVEATVVHDVTTGISVKEIHKDTEQRTLDIELDQKMPLVQTIEVASRTSIVHMIKQKQLQVLSQHAKHLHHLPLSIHVIFH